MYYVVGLETRGIFVQRRGRALRSWTLRRILERASRQCPSDRERYSSAAPIIMRTLKRCAKCLCRSSGTLSVCFDRIKMASTKYLSVHFVSFARKNPCLRWSRTASTTNNATPTALFKNRLSTSSFAPAALVDCVRDSNDAPAFTVHSDETFHHRNTEIRD